MSIIIRELRPAEFPTFVEFWLGESASSDQKQAKVGKFEWLLSRHLEIEPELPFGWMAFDEQRIVGGKLCFATKFSAAGQSVIAAMSSSFRVSPEYGAVAVLLFKRFMSLGSKHPLLATSANASSAKIWRAFGAAAIAGSDCEWTWLGDTRATGEEALFRRHGRARVARALSALTRRRTSPSPPVASPEAWTSKNDRWQVSRSADYWKWRISQAPGARPLYCSNGSSAWVVSADQGGHRGQLQLLRLLAWNSDEALVKAKSTLGRYDGLVANYGDGLHDRGFHPTKLDAARGWILDRAGLFGSIPLQLGDADSDLFS